ncbi:hypothetical protein EYC84_005688 [Monilinia fructicola]|uniref:Uncharacterized protein n=1 Tax=Monilinia fructicola TaxID=38448 RepID=A0A5M9JX86_MONFR|nr:hypothetical protein EYC84_005688 [Monilinia fructicola]
MLFLCSQFGELKTLMHFPGPVVMPLDFRNNPIPDEESWSIVDTHTETIRSTLGPFARSITCSLSLRVAGKLLRDFAVDASRNTSG